MTQARAREVLGVSANAAAAEVRRAFRSAAKQVHPDRPGGDAARFREVVEAYHLLQSASAEPARAAPRFRAAAARVRPRSAEPVLAISPGVALCGGEVEHELGDGRRVRLRLPAGLRAGDKVRADGTELEVVVRGDGQTVVRGDDVWIIAKISPRLLAEGGRLCLETALGRRVVWITPKAVEEGLIRLQGQGLPARGRRRQGHLFVRLIPDPAAESAGDRRRRFAAEWAA